MYATPLIQEHLAARAKVVAFAGWQMPLHYGSQIDEHHAVRQDAGVFDVSHMLAIDVEGPGARAFLRHALANDVDRLARPGKALYACMLNEEGGVLDDLIAYLCTPERYRVVVNAATGDAVLAWLAERCPEDVRLLPRRDLAMLAVQGPRAREKFWSALPELRDATAALMPFSAATAGEFHISRTGYTGEDGFEVMLPGEHAAGTWSRLLAAGVRPCGLGARDTLRLEAGLNLYGQDMDATVTPAECGLDWTVSLSPERDFIGKQALRERTPTNVLLGLILDPGAGVLRPHQLLTTPHGAGMVTSGTFSPTLQASIALARVPPATQPGDQAPVVIRGKQHNARVVKPPFVRNGRILV